MEHKTTDSKETTVNESENRQISVEENGSVPIDTNQTEVTSDHQEMVTDSTNDDPIESIAAKMSPNLEGADEVDNTFVSVPDTKSEPGSDSPSFINPDEPTEKLGTITDEQTRAKRKKYFFIGSVVGVLAIALVGFLVMMQPNQMNKALELGESYLAEGKYKEAILAFDKVLEIDEKVAAAYEGKGASYLSLVDYLHAEEQLEKAKSIEFSDSGKILMSDVYVSTGRKEEGLKLVEEVIVKNPEETKTVIQLGDFYVRISEYNKAIEIMEKQITLTKNKSELKKLYDVLILAYTKAGKIETETLALLERAATATGDETYLSQKDSYLVKKPSFNLTPGEYTGTQNLEVIKGNIEDRVYYTLDGTPPTIASFEYTGPIPLATGEVNIKAIEVNTTGTYSQTLEGKYIIKKAALTEAEFIEALHGGWYRDNGSLVMNFGYNDFIIGRAGSDNCTFGTYTVESTTENGGRIIVTGRMLDKNGTEYQVPYNFDFGVSGDNCVEVSGGGGEWMTFTLGTPLGNNQYSIPSTSGKNRNILVVN